MIDVPRELLGREFHYGESRLSADEVRRYAELVGDEATLAAADEGAVPPTFCLRLHRGMRPEVPLPPGFFGVYGGHDLELVRPLQLGESYAVSSRVSDVYEKSGRTGVMTVVAREARIRSSSGETAVRIHERQIVRAVPQGAAVPPAAVPADASAARLEPFDPSTLLRAQDMPRPPLVVELGAEVGPLQRPATTLEQVARYVSGNEMREGLFTDGGHARRLGYRGIVVPGPMLTAFVEQFLRGSLPGWRLARLGVTFRMPTIAGDALTLHGVVSEHHQRADGEHIVCDVVVEHPSGDRAVTAVARLAKATTDEHR